MMFRFITYSKFWNIFPVPSPQSLRKEKISKFHPRRVLVAKKLRDATRSHQFTRLQTIPSIVTLFKTFSFLLGDGYPIIGKPPEASKHCQSTHAV
ncbi:MAG: hypothetical protein RMY64_08395 [Nostoc sp. DedQUE08]|uniref:hypothetical protein n=1 Tax=unclassified Nostoc TaxID=2593658 RepID=UPI002AD419FC|nr:MULTISPECIES: hypothetical protein [unclassified Nostoc]MDZ8065646.1 hypothetical protein [Nostoc sp. DedQUE08]MDZ8094076.1 hypothetical protein [Nostoc sp. DedQUE05]